MTIKKIRIFLINAILLISAAFGLYALNEDVFFGLIWFFILASLAATLSERIARPTQQLLLYLGMLFLAAVWYIYNDALFFLVSTSVNSNPYGEYLIDQFGFRLTLSIFVLKAILKIWLTDERLIIAILLLLANILIFPGIFRACAMAIPARFFEFVVSVSSHLKRSLHQYFAASFSFALLNSALWCLAAYLLQFDNFILMTFIMFLCAFIPRIGLFVAAVLSLLFVESGLFLIQLGGMLIALASIWFVDHTALRSHILVQTQLPVSLFIVLPVLGYAIFAFPGFFLSAPFFFILAESTQVISKYTPLIHKTAQSVTRKA